MDGKGWPCKMMLYPQGAMSAVRAVLGDDTDGTFAFPNVAPGAYRVLAQHPWITFAAVRMPGGRGGARLQRGR